MPRDLKKLLRCLAWISFIAATCYFIFLFWFATTIADFDPRDNYTEAKAEEISHLIFCKKKLGEEMAWNPSINYNYVFYFKKGSCPPPNKLENVEEIRSLFCAELKEKKSKSYHAAIKKEICPEI